jgi:hypothetical protein
MKLSAARIQTSSQVGPRWRYARYLPLLPALLAGLALRLLLWGNLPRAGMISDEGEYLSAAVWLAHGHGFDWYQGYLWTRAPLYPLFLAAHLRLFGDELAPIYATQTLLSLLNVALVYFLACHLAADRPEDRRQATGATLCASRVSVPGLAALLMALYLPFATYPQMLLSETLFIALLLGGFLALAHWADDQRIEDRGSRIEDRGSRIAGRRSSIFDLRSSVVLAGLLFGLASLTRSIALLFLPIVALWLLLGCSEPYTPAGATKALSRLTFYVYRRRFFSALAFLACAGALILPWTIYNSRMYGGLVAIDTSGAFNLLLGGRTAYDGDRNDAATRDYVLVLLGQKKAADAARKPCTGAFPDPLPASQAARQAAMTREALCLIAARPLAFAAKSLAELVDLFQINYTGAERFTGGFTTGRLPPWYTLSVFLLDDTLYILVLPLAIIGWALARRTLQMRSGNLQSLVGLWCLYNIALAPLLFAINRFRLPLLPFAFIFAALALAAMARAGRRGLHLQVGAPWLALAAALAVVATAPYAYLWPTSEALPSYLGPYPSSLRSTAMALEARPSYLRAEQLRALLQAGDVAAARRTLQTGDVKIERANRAAAPAPALIEALLDGLEGHAADGLAVLPSIDQIARAKDVEAAVVRGDLLRSLGRLDEARIAFGKSSQTGFVDDANPVQWAWDWLHPAPLPNNRLDLAGDLDLGYIEGCYLGEGDPDVQGTFRWCTDGARLRFPRAGTGAPQTLALSADGRGWLGGWLPVPPVRAFLGDQLAGAFTPSHDTVREFAVALPPTPPGADVVVTLRTPVFFPDAARYLSQQSRQAGQAQRLGVRLDWAELRN